LRGLSRALASYGYPTSNAFGGREAAALLRETSFDAIVTDIQMPDMSGVELLRALRQRDDDTPVILMTAFPDVETASEAVSLRAFSYLQKPIDLPRLKTVVGRAIHTAGMERVKTKALLLAGEGGLLGAKYPGLEQSFRRALDTLWMAYQPIVRAVDRSLFGYEALLRNGERTLPSPEAVLDAAERLDRLPKLGHKIWETAAGTFSDAEDQALLFVNLHAADLRDPMLTSPFSPMVAMADRVVLEITERASIDNVDESRETLTELRRLGFRIAIDDLGSGYAGLTSFAAMEPQFAKLDASIVRGVDRSRTKQKIIGSFNSLCNDLSIIVVAEGVETTDERDVLVDLGCDLLQGYLFAKPDRGFPKFVW
jgi:EAL domain-containing protein (putative c-di-GMP-specific phosphodiesterase class I)